MKFKIGKSVMGFDIEVFFDSQEEIADAIRALNELTNRISIENTKIKAEDLWSESDGTRRISETISDSGEKVALALLKSWPDLKSNSDISSMTNLSPTAVYDHLTGRRGDKGPWFEKVGELYTFSKTGLIRVVELIERLSAA